MTVITVLLPIWFFPSQKDLFTAIIIFSLQHNEQSVYSRVKSGVLITPAIDSLVVISSYSSVNLSICYGNHFLSVGPFLFFWKIPKIDYFKIFFV